jgi:glycosyltransferase involved in cell wall biosynthesis
LLKVRSPGPRRVAYLLKRFPRLSETFVLNEILELRRLGVDITVYALMDPLERTVHPAAQALQPEVVYLHTRVESGRSWWRLGSGAALRAAAHPWGAVRLAWMLATVHRSAVSFRHAVESLWLARDLQRRGIGHLHAHFAHSPAAVAHFARLAGGPGFSFTAHAKDLYTTLPRNLRLRARAARFVITCTEHNGGYLKRLLGDGPAVSVNVIHHGTDLRRFHPSPRAPEPGLILSVGRLVPKKGFPTLIEALDRLRDTQPALRCEIFGTGPERSALEGLAAGLRLRDRITFVGARPQDDVIAAYRRAALFVLAPVVLDDGDRDGIPNVLVEAMASGVPVVSTRISGIPELIEDGVDGLLVAPSDPDALAAAMGTLLGNPDLAERLAAAARRKVETCFDLSVNTHRVHELLAGGDPVRVAGGMPVPV